MLNRLFTPLTWTTVLGFLSLNTSRFPFDIFSELGKKLEKLQAPTIESVEYGISNTMFPVITTHVILLLLVTTRVCVVESSAKQHPVPVTNERFSLRDLVFLLE